MITIEETVVRNGDITIRLSDGKTLYITPHEERIFISVSGLGAYGRLKPKQTAANNMDILYEKDGLSVLLKP